MLRKLFTVAFCASFITGCAAQVGVSGPMKIPTDGLAQCQSQCAQMGMGTGAVVVMANTVGCVCEPQSATAKSEGPALSGGMAALILQAERQRREEERRRQAAAG